MSTNHVIETSLVEIWKISHSVAYNSLHAIKIPIC